MSKSFPNNDIIDLDLSVTSKRKFRFDKDDSRVVELNTADMGIISRLNEVQPKLAELQETYTTLASKNLDDPYKIGEEFRNVDNQMRDLVDFIFDAPVCAAAAPSGSMYDPFNGTMRFEHILNVLLGQCEQTLKDEIKKMESKATKHTAKYGKG